MIGRGAEPAILELNAKLQVPVVAQPGLAAVNRAKLVCAVLNSLRKPF